MKTPNLNLALARWSACFSMSLALILAFGLQPLAALTPADLQAKLNAGAKLTVIDVRNLGLYQKSHIPGAINIPAVFCAEKMLPRLGPVVVYDSGVGRDEATPAAAALNAKPGINAEVLEGGFAGWLQAQGPSTQAHGLHPEATPLISYADLKAAQGNNLVLVDLRKPVLQARQNAGDANIAPPAPLTDLRKEFPAAPVASSPFNLPQTRQSGPGAASPLLVLIDSGDGAAQAMAAALKANGISRFAILAGGESILARHGEPGLQRITTSTLPLTPPASVTNK
jgi:rhodanese-related sulfurtransferase